ncbi:immunoglobulin-like domain-containing protein [Micromonospora sp. NPDC048905]|uniref:immunoglobulin-like domain-containing protein n=1 Tax=Micromonospora sp. NPDC048905 TaxID=3155494 RepID=UPI003406872A
MRLRQRRPRLGLSRKGRGVAVLALGALLSVSFAATPSHAAEEHLDEGLVHHFALDETSGTTLVNSGSAGAAANATLVNPEKAALTGEGVRFNPDSYEGALDGAYVALPNDITAGMSNLTVDYDVWVDPANVGEHQMWGFGRKSGSCDVDTGAEGSIFASNTQRFRVAVGPANLQQNRVRMLEGAWTHVTYTQSLNSNGTSWTGRLYLDGVLHATSTDLTTAPSVNAAGTNCNFLGRSQTSGHYSFRGTIRDFRVYDRAVRLDETLLLAEKTVSDGVRADAAAIDLGLTSAVVRDVVLPKVGSVAGSTITWTSSDPSVVEVNSPPALASARKVAVTGRITRPAQGQPDATATLTATVRKGGQEVTTREIPVVVKAEFDDAQAVDRDAFDLTLADTDDVRGNLDLAAKGEFGSTITWKSTTGLVTPTGAVSRPAFGHEDVAATLTATITKGSASEKKSFPVTITAMPRTEEYERYFMGYFKGEGIADGEQIMFATSNGNTALDWTGLTGGRPSLISQLGDQGLRDPHIVRSPDGDTFYMIATDLNWYDQGGYAINDTQYIEVFESHDLVNWTPQRHVKVAPDNAGNAFAPESLWVEEIGAYVVFWAQSLWSDPVNRTGQGNAQMWYATTRDFQTFSAPQVWQDPAPLSRIDTTAIRVGDHYYRVTKNEAGNQGSDIFSEKHTDFLDSNIDNWTLVAPALGRTTWAANQGYEGPVVFKANPGDTSCPGQFYLWGDRYTNGGGYQAACHEDIEAPTWNAKAITMTNAGVVRPRHGTVIPLTVREWNDIRGIPNSDVTTTTEVAVEPYASGAQTTTATVTVTAADGFETGGQVRLSIGSWSKLAHLHGGAATVTLPTGLPAGARTVKAEYLGFDYLKASVGTASFEVPSGTAAVKVQAKAKPASVVRGGTFRLNVTVGPAGGRRHHAPTPTGEVTVTFGGTVHVVPLADGRAVVELPTAKLQPGAYRVHVAYSGNPTYRPHAANHQTLTVRKPHRHP